MLHENKVHRANRWTSVSDWLTLMSTCMPSCSVMAYVHVYMYICLPSIICGMGYSQTCEHRDEPDNQVNGRNLLLKTHVQYKCTCSHRLHAIHYWLVLK